MTCPDQRWPTITVTVTESSTGGLAVGVPVNRGRSTRPGGAWRAGQGHWPGRRRQAPGPAAPARCRGSAAAVGLVVGRLGLGAAARRSANFNLSLSCWSAMDQHATLVWRIAKDMPAYIMMGVVCHGVPSQVHRCSPPSSHPSSLPLTLWLFANSEHTNRDTETQRETHRETETEIDTRNHEKTETEIQKDTERERRKNR